MPLTFQQLPYEHWEYLDIPSGDRLRIVPERGGLITEWRCNDSEILYFDSERFQQSNKSVRGGIPILFPICGDLPGGCLTLAKGDFLINQHGFARNISWQICDLEDQNGFLMSVSTNETTYASYPYYFLIKIYVTLNKGRLDFSVSIENKTDEPMPFSFGLHPYFQVTDLQHISIEGLPEKCMNHLNNQTAETYTQLEKVSEGIDFLARPSHPVKLIDCLNGRNIQLITEEPMDLVVIWSDPPRSMVCLEPWTSPRYALINGDRRLIIEPWTVKSLKCSIAVN